MPRRLLIFQYWGIEYAGLFFQRPVMISPIDITVNGEAATLAEDHALTTLLIAQGIAPDAARGVAVAINDRVIRRQLWPSTDLAAGDRVEIVTARQGG